MEELLVEKDGKVLNITFNRPDKLNPFSKDVCIELKKTLENIQNDDGVSVIVFKGAGEKAFSSGFDLQQLMAFSNEERLDFFERITQILNLIFTTDKIFIGAINGIAVGAGFAINFFMDFRLAVDNPDIYFSLPDIKIGLFPYGAISMFYQLLPPAIATKLLFTGEKMSLAEIKQWGFIHATYPAPEFDKAVRKFAKEFVRLNPRILKLTKACYNIERQEILQRFKLEQQFMKAGFDQNTDIDQFLKTIKASKP